jgi:peptidoglycan/LPS O-acetylase OafA/YrhL
LLGVLAFHADGVLKGGYLGVDLFFVLSGFLITRILLAEQRAAGRIELAAFWVRRARRLFPALLALMPAIGVYATFVATPGELAGIRGDALATLGYVANWRAILADKSYWELFVSPSPLEHTWSLSIEEQFYVVWPLVVVVVLRRFGVRALFVVSAGLALCSMLAMAALFDPQRTMRAYYGTDTRAAAILAGAAFACVAPRSPVSGPAVRLLDGAGVLALLGLGWSWWALDGRDFFLYRGGFWLVELLSLVLIACALAGGRSFVARLLSFAPLRAVGLVSYGAYLWHWPVNLVLTSDRCHVHGLTLHALRVAVTFGIAAVSYRFLERPIRKHGVTFGRPRVIVPVAFAAAALSVLVGARPRPAPRATSKAPPVATSKLATAPVPVRLRVRVLGDSTANAIGWMLKSVAAPDVAVELRAKDGLNLIYADHIRWTDDDDRVGVTLVSVGGAFLYGIHVGPKWTFACHPRWDALFEEGLDLHLKDLATSKSELWLTTAPYPVGPYDYEARRDQVDCINRSLRKVSQHHPRVRLLELAELVCPKGECTREVNGRPLRPDGVHYDVEVSAELARRVLTTIDPIAARAAPAVSVAVRP